MAVVLGPLSPARPVRFRWCP